jgi:hypothetical protein
MPPAPSFSVTRKCAMFWPIIRETGDSRAAPSYGRGSGQSTYGGSDTVAPNRHLPGNSPETAYSETTRAKRPILGGYGPLSLEGDTSQAGTHSMHSWNFLSQQASMQRLRPPRRNVPRGARPSQGTLLRGADYATATAVSTGGAALTGLLGSAEGRDGGMDAQKRRPPATFPATVRKPEFPHHPVSH